MKWKRILYYGIVSFITTAGSFLWAIPIRYEFPISDYKNIFYVETPEQLSYPLLIVIEGSFVEKKGLQSVLRLHNKLAPSFLDHGIAIITMERRGVDGNNIDEQTFHEWNMPSQRLIDHKALIQYLHEHPPQNWNGQLFIMGGSEGGPIAIKLSHAIHPTACIPIVGCSDQSFKEYIWNVIQNINPIAKRLYRLPKNQQDYELQMQKMKENPDPNQFWFGQTFRYWSDALDQTEFQEFLNLSCPVLVITGSKDVGCSSTDRLIEKARQNNQDVMYLRIKGMKHDALNPKWNVTNLVIEYIERYKISETH